MSACVHSSIGGATGGGRNHPPGASEFGTRPPSAFLSRWLLEGKFEFLCEICQLNQRRPTKWICNERREGPISCFKDHRPGDRDQRTTTYKLQCGSNVDAQNWKSAHKPFRDRLGLREAVRGCRSLRSSLRRTPRSREGLTALTVESRAVRRIRHSV